MNKKIWVGILFIIGLLACGNIYWLPVIGGGGTYLDVDGVDDNAATVDSATNSITGDLTIDVEVLMPDYTPLTVMTFLAKFDWTGNQRSYMFEIRANGQFRFYWSWDGTNQDFVNIASGVSYTDGTKKHFRITADVDNGAGGSDFRLYDSDDGSTWTQRGSTQTKAFTTSIFDGTASLYVAAANGGTDNECDGDFYHVKLYNSDLGSGSGTPVWTMDPADWVSGSSWTDAVSGETITLNGNATIQ